MCEESADAGYTSLMNTKVTPKDFFLWASAMVAIYGGIIAFITLLFEYINYAYPDVLSYYSDPFSGSIRFSMASLLVLVPVAVLIMRLIRSDIARDSSKQDLWVRRWALYLTLFIAGTTVVVDLITLINYLLGGELTIRFILKVATVLLVAGAAFLHFLADLRGYWSQYPARAKIVSWAVGVVVVAAIASGFLIMGSPNQVRLYRYDGQKVSDLQNIQWQIVNYWQQKQTLPNSLTELEDPISGATIPLDPQSKEAYTYRKTGALTFELCALFNAESNNEVASLARDPYYYGVESENWQHVSGEVCFERTIDPERYPPYKK